MNNDDTRVTSIELERSDLQTLLDEYAKLDASEAENNSKTIERTKRVDLFKLIVGNTRIANFFTKARDDRVKIPVYSMQEPQRLISTCITAGIPLRAYKYQKQIEKAHTAIEIAKTLVFLSAIETKAIQNKKSGECLDREKQTYLRSRDTPNQRPDQSKAT
jgi:hypothetical protein